MLSERKNRKEKEEKEEKKNGNALAADNARAHTDLWQA